MMPHLEPPRSVYVAFEAFPRPKGAASHIGAMVTALAGKYAPVWLLCCGYADMPALQFEGDIIIHRHKLHHPNMLKRSREFAEFVYSRLKAATSRPEILTFRDPWGGRPALSALSGCPAVFEVNGLPSLELPYTHPAIRANPALRAKIEDVERFCLRSVQGVVTVSGLTRELLPGMGVDRERIFVVPNSADDIFFRAGGLDCPLDILNHGRWFGYIGSLHPWQGVDLLVDAWARIAEEQPDVRLLLVHNGRRAPLKLLRKRLRKRGLAGRVFLQSPLSPERLAAVLARLEFTCAPLAETFRNTVQGCCPVKIVESMAAGTPVLASDLRVNRDLLDDGVNGMLAPAGNVRAWASALRRLLSDEGLRGRLADGAARTARERFTRRLMRGRLEAVWDSVANGLNESLIQ